MYPHFIQMKKSSWEGNVLFADIKKKQKSLFGAEMQPCDLFVSWKITFRFWNQILDEEESPELQRVGLIKKKIN